MTPAVAAVADRPETMACKRLAESVQCVQCLHGVIVTGGCAYIACWQSSHRVSREMCEQRPVDRAAYSSATSVGWTLAGALASNGFSFHFLRPPTD